MQNNSLCPPYLSCLSQSDIGCQDIAECIECEGEYGDLNQDFFRCFRYSYRSQYHY